MNTVDCPLSATILGNGINYNEGEPLAIESRLNAILYDLQPGKNYELKISNKASSCPSIGNSEKVISFDAEDKKVKKKLPCEQCTGFVYEFVFQVTGFLIRQKGGSLDVNEVQDAEEPKKSDDAAPRLRQIMHSC